MTAGPLRSVTLPGDAGCPGPRLEGDPRLGPLTANGGPTLTLLPGAGSVAIDALAGVPCPATDQRGLPRPRLGGCDAGSVEVQPEDAVATGPGAGATSSSTARRVSGLRLRPATFRAAGAGGSIGTLTTALARRARDRHHRRLPPRRRRPSHLHDPQAPRGPAGGQALRSAGRCPTRGSPLHPPANAHGQLRPPGGARPEQLPLHRPPASQGPPSGVVHPGRQTAPDRARGRGDRHPGLPDRAVRMRRTIAFVAGAALAGLVAVPLAAAKPRTVSFVSVVKTYQQSQTATPRSVTS